MDCMCCMGLSYVRNQSEVIGCPAFRCVRVLLLCCNAFDTVCFCETNQRYFQNILIQSFRVDALCIIPLTPQWNVAHTVVKPLVYIARFDRKKCDNYPSYLTTKTIDCFVFSMTLMPLGFASICFASCVLRFFLVFFQSFTPDPVFIQSSHIPHLWFQLNSITYKGKPQYGFTLNVYANVYDEQLPARTEMWLTPPILNIDRQWFPLGAKLIALWPVTPGQTDFTTT